MKAKTVTYSRLISIGNYENAKIEIQLEVEEGEKANDVFNRAKEFVEKKIDFEKVPHNLIRKAEQVLEDRRNHTIAQVEEAESLLEKWKSKETDDLPF